MTDSSLRSRQPKGIPVGGQFAASAHAESGLTLLDPGIDPTVDDEGLTAQERADLDAENADMIAAHEANEARYEAEMAAQEWDRGVRRWGDLSHIQEGSRTPWGAAQVARQEAPGIVVVHCAGHGGIKLSPERNAEIPPALRSKSGWYEEDCEASVVGMYYPEAFGHYLDSDEARRAAFEASVKNWSPDEYTKATGKPVAVEESSELRDRAKRADKEAFRAEHSGEFVTLGNGDTHADWIPSGYAACAARLDDTGETRTFLMPRSEVIHDHSYGRNALVDPARHLDVTDVVNAQPATPYPYHSREVPRITGEDLGVDYSGLTDAQASRARAELDKRWRFRNDDGTEVIETMGENLARRGVVGKGGHMQDGKMMYRLALGDSRVQPVSKATFDAMTGVPDTRTEADHARIAYYRAENAHHREQGKRDFSREGAAKREKTGAAVAAAREEMQRLSDIESAKASEWQAERARLQTEAFTRIAEARGVTFE